MVELSQDFSNESWTMLLYGQSGIGKTTFAVRAPRPLVINIENGLKGIDLKAAGAWATSPIESWQEVRELMMKGGNQDRFDTFVVDSVTKLQELIIKDICQADNKASLADFAYGSGYARFAAQAALFCEMMDMLKREGKNVILIAHEAIETFADPEHDAFDRFNVALDKRIAERIKAAVDHVWRMHHEKTIKEQSSGRKSARHRGRILVQTYATGSAIAKTRGNREQFIEVENNESASHIWRTL